MKWPQIRSWSTAFLCHTSSLVNDGRVGCPRATSSMSGVITVISESYGLFLLISVWWPRGRRDSVTSGVWEGVNLHHLANVLITDLHCLSSVVLMKSLGQPYACSTWFEGWAGTLWMQMSFFVSNRFTIMPRASTKPLVSLDARSYLSWVVLDFSFIMWSRVTVSCPSG